MNKANYYTEGVYTGAFEKNADLLALLESIRNIHNKNIKPGFELVGKYKNSQDLRPDVFSYDPSFVNILISNNIPKLLKDVVGRELYLAHIQLRISYPGESYMSWHRDTHLYGGKLTGNMPPAHKIIFYPTVDGKSEEKIKVLPGSHRKVFKNRFLDYIQVFFSKKKTIMSSDSQFMLFNTELFHHVVPESQAKGSFRLIYSFVEHDQLVNYPEGEKLIQMYKEKMK